MNSKKSHLNFFVGLCVISIILFFTFNFTTIAIAAEGKSDIKFITFASGTSDWGLIGAKVAEIINKDIPEITATSIPGGGTINLSQVQSGEAQLGLVHSFLPYLAYNGLDIFKEKHTKIRVIMSLNVCKAQVSVPFDSDITSISDLIKKPYSVYISTPGQGTYIIIQKTFEAFGITPEKISEIGGIVHTVGLNDGARMMKDRMLDFFFSASSVPNPLLMDIDFSIGIKLLPIDGEAREKLLNSLPGLVEGVVPANSYKKQDKDVPTVSFFNQIICNSELPDDLVYEITAAIVNHFPEFKELSASLKELSLDMATLGTGIPFHPGAEKYYIEHDMFKK